MTKPINSNCDKTKKKLENSSSDKISKTWIVTKLEKSSCNKTRKLNLWQNSKIKWWKNWKTQIVTVLVVTVVKVAVVTVVKVTSFSKNNWTPRQPMRSSQGSFLRFLRCLKKKFFWDTSRTLLGNFWDTSGLLFIYLLDIFGYFWDLFGILLQYFWDTFLDTFGIF